MILLAALAAVTAFNVSCVGTEKVTSKHLKPLERPFERVYRVDLMGRRWCLDKCSETRPIVRATKTQIVLYESIDSVTKARTTLDREQGTLFEFFGTDTGYLSITTAVCKGSKFTGFPALKF